MRGGRREREGGEKGGERRWIGRRGDCGEEGEESSKGSGERMLNIFRMSVQDKDTG